MVCFPVGKDPMEETHWFLPKTIKFSNYGLCFIGCVEIICFWSIYDQFWIIIHLLHYVGSGSIMYVFWIY